MRSSSIGTVLVRPPPQERTGAAQLRARLLGVISPRGRSKPARRFQCRRSGAVLLDARLGCRVNPSSRITSVPGCVRGK